MFDQTISRATRIAVAAAGFFFIAFDARAACTAPDGGIGVSRVVEIDATNGPIFGSMTKQDHEPSFLKPKEVVLTFDDGPMPWITKSILDTLDAFCTKATFFSVGEMAVAYPDMSKDVLARGHTLGTHTYTHPFNLPLRTPSYAIGEIERGIAGVMTAAGAPIAPFFRFTGLSDSASLLAYLQTRGIASFTVDVVSNDSYISDPARLVSHTMAEIAQTNGGIILFHDIKRATTKALPIILAKLKAQGYTVVHMKAKSTVTPLADAMVEVAAKIAKKKGSDKAVASTPGATVPVQTASASDALEVTSIAPPPRDRKTTSHYSAKAPADKPKAGKVALKRSVVEKGGFPFFLEAEAVPAPTSTWKTHVSPKSVKRAKTRQQNANPDQ